MQGVRGKGGEWSVTSWLCTLHIMKQPRNLRTNEILSEVEPRHTRSPGTTTWPNAHGPDPAPRRGVGVGEGTPRVDPRAGGARQVS